MSSSPDPRVLLIGWDAADWQFIHPMLDAGLLPNVQRIVEGGVIGNLAFSRRCFRRFFGRVLLRASAHTPMGFAVLPNLYPIAPDPADWHFQPQMQSALEYSFAKRSKQRRVRLAGESSGRTGLWRNGLKSVCHSSGECHTRRLAHSKWQCAAAGFSERSRLSTR